MNIPIKLTRDFEQEMDRLVAKYGEDFEYLNGFHESQINFSDFIDGFIDKNVADITIDANANASHKDIRSLLNEKGKSLDKLFGFNKIFYEIKKKYGLQTARDWLEQEYNGGFYMHDAPSASYMPYCYAFDLSRLAREGLFFLPNYNNEPPKHLTTFVDDVIEFVSFFSNRSSGAVGLPNILVWTYYFWKKDIEENYYLISPDYYLRQTFQKLIYRLNQPFLRVDQSSFTNMSIFDREYAESLFGGLIYPDGTCFIDCIEEFIEHQKTFMEVVSEIRNSNMMTFPVLSYSLLFQNGKFVDEDFARWCSNHNTLWNDSNFFVSSDVSTLSNCPMHGDTKILYWNDRYKQFNLSPIKQLFLDKKDQVIKVLSEGRTIECRVHQYDIPAEYEITLVNGTTLKTTANHLNKVYGKDYTPTSELTVNDYLPYTLHSYEVSDAMSYEDGVLIGMFLGDGSYHNDHGITFSLNPETDQDDIDFIYDYCSKHFNAKFSSQLLTSDLSGKQSCINVNVNSDYCRGLIQQYVVGNGALDKSLNLRALNCSIDFRKGIIDGLYTTDGGNSNRIYTSSEKLKDSLVVLFASLGMITNITVDNREGRLGTNPNYVIRFYTPGNRTRLKDVYIIDKDFMWIKIKSITRIAKTEKSYCLEVIDGSEPVFMLGNGIHTHNCRLLSSVQKLSGFINSIGGTALSIGSVKVNTTNLVRLYYEANGDTEKYLELLHDRIELSCKALWAQRHIIQRNIEKGLLPNFCDGGVEMDKCYSTIGILGVYETIKAFGFIKKDEFGNVYYTDEGIDFGKRMFAVINEVKDNFTTEFSLNVESVPAERAAIILCSKDHALYEINNDEFIYSNQWTPLAEQCTLNERIKLSSIFDNLCSGGSILHVNIDSNFPNNDSAWDMLNYIAKSGVIYFAFNTRINACENHHGFVGTDICPECGKPVYDTYQRIVGYLSPSKAYSKERFKEFNARKWYDLALEKGE